MPETKLHLIGLAPDLAWLPPAALSIINEAEILAGGDRLLDLFPMQPGERLPLSAPLSKWLEKIEKLRSEGRRVAVLTSGDPGHFGLAKTLFKVISCENVVMIPSPTIVQQAFARLGRPWEGCEVVSLHGRGETFSDFWGAVYRCSHCSGPAYLAVYTDANNSPNLLAKRLLDRGQQHWRMTVCEDLGAPDERISSITLFEARLREFSPLNLVILECQKKGAHIYLGMPEESFVHEAGLITKREVRAATLAALELMPTHNLWDLGAGSGSVSIEAAALLHHGAVWAVEKSHLRCEQISANRTYFGAAQVEIVEGEALEAMAHLPAPDRIFIGGGGQGLPQIILAAAGLIKTGGIIVANVVSLGPLAEAAKAMMASGLEVDVSQIQAARSAPLGGSLYFKPINQVWIIKGRHMAPLA